VIKIEIYRCNVCGDPWVLDKMPDRCPFCGAKDSFVLAKEYDETFDVELGETDAKNARSAMELEESNVAFYKKASQVADDPVTRQMFKALSKIEAEHASIWRKILKLQPDKVQAQEKCPEDSKQIILESSQREDRAITFYKTAAGQAKNMRVKQLFSSLADIESEHLQLDEELK